MPNLILAESDISTALSSILSSMTAELTPANIAAVIGVIVGGTIGLVLLWFGIRKLVNAVQSAFKSGKIRI